MYRRESAKSAFPGSRKSAIGVLESPITATLDFTPFVERHMNAGCAWLRTATCRRTSWCLGDIKRNGWRKAERRQVTVQVWVRQQSDRWSPERITLFTEGWEMGQIVPTYCSTHVNVIRQTEERYQRKDLTW